jgi:DNA-binding response OmpR family regulator
MNILLIEDDKHFGAALVTCFEQDGYSINWVESAAESIAALNAKKYDCVLLDLGLPDISGERLLEAVRAQNDTTPFIVITARGLIQDRISLLDLGADDYMVKPVDIYELSARVRAAVRRANPGEARGATINFGPLALMPVNLTATWHGEPVQLSTKEFWVLEIFMRMKGEVLSLRQLEEILYGFGDEVGSNAVQVHIHHIRKKFSPDLIRTVHGLGYQFIPPTVAV